MRFFEYKYRDNDPNTWNFTEFELRNLNLLVGQTSAGKTRLLRSLFNLGFVAIREKVDKFGKWEVRFQTSDKVYRYKLETVIRNTGPCVTKEALSQENGTALVDLLIRDEHGFYFNDRKMPRLPTDQTGIHLLADEELITPVADGFGRMQMRQFDHDELEKTGVFAVVDPGLDGLLHERKSLMDLWRANVPLSLKLHYLKKFFPDRYTSVVNQFKDVFPYVTSCDVYRMKREDIPFETKGIVPIFVVSEKGVKGDIGVQELSSGMKKVLLILTDVVSAPAGTVYLVDEYENSLGVNAIDFLPDFILDYESSIQFIISTHHPYLINEIGIDNWLILTRNGSKVSITQGTKLKERYGKSKQQAFTQLLNDPLYFQPEP